MQSFNPGEVFGSVQATVIWNWRCCVFSTSIRTMQATCTSGRGVSRKHKQQDALPPWATAAAQTVEHASKYSALLCPPPVGAAAPAACT